MYVVYETRAQVGNMRSDVAAVMANLEGVVEISRRLNLGNDMIPPLSNWKIASAEPNSKTIEWFETVAAGHHVGVDEHRAEAYAIAGRLEEAREYLESEIRFAESMAGSHGVGGVLGFAGARIEFWAGNLQQAISNAERGAQLLIDSGQLGVGSTVAGICARICFAAGEYERAAEWAQRAEQIGAPDDVLTRLGVLQVTALLQAHRGETAAAQATMSEALALAETTHSPVILGDVTFDSGLVYEMVGARDQAVAAYREALSLYEAKEHIVMAQSTRQRLADLEG
jgi:tetratricopeptide (TPR) repeat protein